MTNCSRRMLRRTCSSTLTRTISSSSALFNFASKPTVDAMAFRYRFSFFPCNDDLFFQPPKCPTYGAPAESHNSVGAYSPQSAGPAHSPSQVYFSRSSLEDDLLQPTPYHPPPAGAHPVMPQYPPQSSSGAGPQPYEGVFNPPLSPVEYELTKGTESERVYLLQSTRVTLQGRAIVGVGDVEQ